MVITIYLFWKFFHIERYMFKKKTIQYIIPQKHTIKYKKLP